VKVGFGAQRGNRAGAEHDPHRIGSVSKIGNHALGCVMFLPSLIPTQAGIQILQILGPGFRGDVRGLIPNLLKTSGHAIRNVLRAPLIPL
jgi:hypothetical protein